MICLLGQNHKTAPVELREKLAVTDEKRAALADLLRTDRHVDESVVLSTCNRMELYAICADPSQSGDRLGGMLAEVHGLARSEWDQTLYYRQDQHAVRHLFRVASGLDSMVLGEGQILSQVKDAHSWALEQKLSREVLNRAFDEAVFCGKRVRTDTQVSQGSVSVASAAVSLSKKIFSDLAEQSVLLIGAGDTGARVARHLQLFGVRDLRVCNRTRARAEDLAAELEATLVPWQNLDDQLPEVSIVVTAVAAPEPILSRDRMKRALRSGDQRALFVIDLAVPRNVHPDVSKIAGVFVYDVDDLQGIVVEDEDQRRSEAAKAEEIVDDEVHRFVDWYRARAAVPTLRELRSRIESLRGAELEAARGRLDGDAYAELERVTQRLVNKILHSPTVELKRQVLNGDLDSSLGNFRRIFALDEDDR